MPRGFCVFRRKNCIRFPNPPLPSGEFRHCRTSIFGFYWTWDLQKSTGLRNCVGNWIKKLEPLDYEIGLGALNAGGESRLSGFVPRGVWVGGITFVFQTHAPVFGRVPSLPHLSFLDFTGHGIYKKTLD